MKRVGREYFKEFDNAYFNQKMIIKNVKLNHKLNNNPGGRLLKSESRDKPKSARGLFGASHLGHPQGQKGISKSNNLEDTSYQQGVKRVDIPLLRGEDKEEVPRSSLAPIPTPRGYCSNEKSEKIFNNQSYSYVCL